MFENKPSRYRDVNRRAQWWDYRINASYFVTICLKPRVFHFGTICKGIMCLSDTGTIAHRLWEELPLHFPFVSLGEFIVMPDHIHGIVNIDSSCPMMRNENSPGIDVKEKNQRMSTISPKPGSLASVIRSYKSAVTKTCRETNPDFKWQSLYHDRIIRTLEEYDRISAYIYSNPARWLD